MSLLKRMTKSFGALNVRQTKAAKKKNTEAGRQEEIEVNEHLNKEISTTSCVKTYIVPGRDFLLESTSSEVDVQSKVEFGSAHENIEDSTPISNTNSFLSWKN